MLRFKRSFNELDINRFPRGSLSAGNAAGLRVALWGRWVVLRRRCFGRFIRWVRLGLLGGPFGWCYCLCVVESWVELHCFLWVKNGCGLYCFGG